MKTKITVLLATVFMATASLAQKPQTPAKDGASSQGFRVGLVKPVLDFTGEATNQGYTALTETRIDDLFGVSLGYASLPVRGLGWTANATYLLNTNMSSLDGLARVDANLAYAFTSIVNIKGGVNLSKFFISSGSLSELNAGLGFQGGVGIQLTKNFGLDLGYTQMRQSGSTTDGIRFDMKEAGFEIGLHGTF